MYNNWRYKGCHTHMLLIPWASGVKRDYPRIAHWLYTLQSSTHITIKYVTVHKQIGHNVQKHENMVFCSIIALELQRVQSSFLVWQL